MAHHNIISPLDESTLDSDVEVSSVNLQKLLQKNIISIPENDSPNHISCCLLSKKICITAGKSLMLFNLLDNKVVSTITFEKCLSQITCCETVHMSDNIEWIAVSDDDDGIYVLNVNTKEKSFAKVSDIYSFWESSTSSNLLLSVSKKDKGKIRMLASYKSGAIFISQLYDPLLCGGIPLMENFINFNIRNIHPKLLSFHITFLDVDSGSVICATTDKCNSFLSILDCHNGNVSNTHEESNSHYKVISESMVRLQDGTKCAQPRVLVADNDDCMRAIIHFGGVIFIWNVDVMSLEKIWESREEEIIDVIKIQSDITLFFKRAFTDASNSSNCLMSIELRSFPSMTLKRRFEAGQFNSCLPFASCSLFPGSNINCYETEENIYYLLCEKQLRLMSIEQADVGSRILKLISKGDFGGAEKLAAAFKLDTSPALKAKFSFCMNYLNNLLKILTISGRNELEDELQYKNILRELNQCLRLPFISCEDLECLLNLVLPFLDDTIQLLNAVKTKLDDLENSSGSDSRKIALTRCHLHDITHRLGTYMIVCCNFKMRDWKQFLKSPVRRLFVKFIKKGWLESAEVIWSRHRNDIISLNLVKTEVSSILSSIPKLVCSVSIIRFIKSVIIPEVVHSLDLVMHVADWVQNKARQLEISEPSLWPQNAISLCQVFDFEEEQLCLDSFETLNYSLNFNEMAAKICHLTSVANYIDSEDDPIAKIQNLIAVLHEVNDLKTKYGCSFSLSTLEIENVEAIAFRMLDRIVAVELVVKVVNDVIRPYLLSKNMITNDVLFKYVKARINSNDANVEKMVQIIRCIECFASKCHATECLMQFAAMPWVDQLTNLVNELLSTEHPLVMSIRKRYISNSLEKLLSSYGFSRRLQHCNNVENVMERILRSKGKETIKDCLMVAKHGKHPVSDVFFLKAELLCSEGENDGVVDLMDQSSSYLLECEDDSSQVQDLMADKLIELGKWNGSSRFCSYETRVRHHQNAINLLSLQMEKFAVPPGREMMSLCKNKHFYESCKQRLSNKMQCHFGEFAYLSAHLDKQNANMMRCKYESLLKDHLFGTSSNNDMKLLSMRLEEVAKSLSEYPVMDFERNQNKHRWIKLILKCFEETSDYSTKIGVDDFDFLSVLEPKFESGRLKFAWSDVSKVIKELIEQDFSLNKALELVQILHEKRQEYLCLQTCSIIFLEMYYASVRTEEILDSTIQSQDVKCNTNNKEGFSIVKEHLKTLASSLIEKLCHTLQCPELVLSLLCSCFDEDDVVNKLAKCYLSSTGKLKIQKMIAMVALSYHGLKNLSEKFFPVLSLDSNWAYRLRKYGIKFNSSEKIESISAMATCIPFNVSWIFHFTKDFQLNIKEVCLKGLDTLLNSKNLISPLMLSKASIFCRGACKIFDMPDDLFKLFMDSLESTDGKNYEKIEFILNCMSKIEQSFSLNNTLSNNAQSQHSTLDKLNFLNFLKSYKPVKTSSTSGSLENFSTLQIMKRSKVGSANQVKVEEPNSRNSMERLSFHIFFKKEVWMTIKSELNQNTIDLWRSVAGPLKISEDNIIVEAMKNIMNEALYSVNSHGGEISDDTISLLISLNQSVSSASDAVKVCDWMIDCMPEMHLKQKLLLYELCESLCKVWLNNEKSDAASKVRSNCIYQRKKILAKQIFIEKGFNDLVTIIDKDFSDGDIWQSNQAEQLIEKLYEHEIIHGMWNRKKCFSYEDSSIYAAVEHLVALFELNLEKIQIDLLAKWLPSNLQIKQEMENISVMEGFEFNNRNLNEDEDLEESKRLVLAIHLLCHMNPDKALSLLKEIVLEKKMFSECKLRALKCLLRLFSPDFVAVQLSYTRSELVIFITNLIAHAQLEKLGISENVEEFSDLDKPSLIKELIRSTRSRSSSVVTTLVATFAVSYKVIDINILNPVVQVLIDLEHFQLARFLLYNLLRSSLKVISASGSSLEWFQEKIFLLVSRLIDSSDNLNLQMFDLFLIYPGCIVTNEKHMRDIKDLTSTYSQINMEPCTFAISLISKDLPEMRFACFLSKEYQSKVLARLEEWTREGLVFPLSDRIKFSIKNSLSCEAESPLVQSEYDMFQTTSDALDASHVIDFNITFDGYFHNQESFIQEFQSVLNATAFNATMCQI